VNPTQTIGWCACALMLATFWCETAWCLRSFAVAANLAFIAYGWSGNLPPVMALHLLLLPINALRLYKAVQILKTKPAIGPCTGSLE